MKKRYSIKHVIEMCKDHNEFCDCPFFDEEENDWRKVCRASNALHLEQGQGIPSNLDAVSFVGYVTIDTVE